VDETAAISIAKDQARQDLRDLDNFNTPIANFVEGRWIVRFEGKRREPGNHFLVIVDDVTGRASSVAGH
jgi:hypothetical protein